MAGRNPHGGHSIRGRRVRRGEESRERAMDMIVVKNIKKSFDQGLVAALNGITFTVEEGEAVSIMGPSGCGKTTLLNLIGALDRPTEGEIWLDGENIHLSGSLDSLRASTVGFVFQFHHLIPNLTLRENVEIPMYTRSVSRKTMREKATALLNTLDLSGRKDFFPSRVSGGERQRAAIARAMINDPKILLVDEPTGSLDTATGEKVLDTLLQLCDTRKLTMLLSTHNPRVAQRTSRIIHMKDGLLT
jgi:putative ABC transport system ATP-binding protein